MKTLRQDVRYGLRMLARSPGFTAVAVLSIALGIGVNTTIFSFINAALFRPLPFPDPQRLVRVWDGMGSSYPDYVAYRDESRVFDGLAAYAERSMSLTVNGETELVGGEIVSGNYFDVLAVKPAIGRGFLAGEDRTTGTHPIVVVSHDLWRGRFNSDPNLVGKSLNINDHPYTIIGVMPENFVGASTGIPPDFWVPMMMEPFAKPGSRSLTSPDDGWLEMLGRLKSDVNLVESQAAIETVASRLHQARRERRSESEGMVERRAEVVPARGWMLAPKNRTSVFLVLGLVMAVVSLVLLVACANVANMLLARAANRRKEIAVRLALGAGRWRIVRQMLTESVLLALFGGAAGLVLALWSTDLLLALLPQNSVTPDVSPDVRVFGYTLLLSVATGIVFGLVPALQASKPDVVSALKDEGVKVGRGRRRKLTLRNLLVVTQVSVSLLLLVAAGLFIRSLRNTQHAEPGFALENSVMASFDLGLANYDKARGKVFQEQLLERVRALPQVRSAALAEHVPLGGGGSVSPLYVEGEPVEAARFDEDSLLSHNAVGSDYFKTMGIPLVRGRDFNEQDTTSSPAIIIVNETLARRIAPDGNAVGKRLRMDSKGDYLEVVGVARDIKYRQLAEMTPFYAYRALAQRYRSAMTLHVSTVGDPSAVIKQVRAEVKALDPNLPLTNVVTMGEHMRLPLAPAKLFAWLTSALGFLALLLASVGLYGVMAYLVSNRTQEIGIRIALGANQRDVLRLILIEGLTLVGVGILCGLLASLAATRVMRTVLYNVSANDPTTFASVAMLLAGVALVACYIPARRAMKVDPMVALRYE